MDFAEKLNLVMKRLSLSRGGLASAVGVDKSVAGRWASGKVKPSAHNIARLSQYVGEHIAGFTMLDWDRDAESFQALIQSERSKSAASKSILPLLPEKLAREAAFAAAERTKAYEGIWRTTRPSSDLPGQFLHDISIVRRDEDGVLHFRSGVEGFFYEGSTVMVQQQLYYFAADDAFGAISFGILNGVPRQKAEVIEGVILTTLRDAGASPAASGLIMERIADLTGDKEEDEAHFERLVKNQKMIAEPGSVSQEIADHLHAASNAPGMLRMLFNQSMSRGPLLNQASSSRRLVDRS